MKTKEIKKKGLKAKYTDKEVEQMAEAYRIHIRNIMNQCLNKPVFEEGVGNLMDAIITKFEALVEDHDHWLTEAFQQSLNRVRYRQQTNGSGEKSRLLFFIIILVFWKCPSFRYSSVLLFKIV